MSQPLTDQQHTDIRTREQAATPGPWFNDGHEIYVGTPDDYTRHSLWIGETCNIDLPDQGAANGAFLAGARQDVPALLGEVERLRAELEQARQQTADAIIAGLTATHDHPETAERNRPGLRMAMRNAHRFADARES